MKDLLKENVEFVIAFRATLNSVTDRGCALMAGAYLENELERLLRSKFIGTKKQIDELFNSNGPIGTFSSKIKLAYSLGFISVNVMKDLEIIRKVRNEFGHNFNPIDFETENINNQIQDLNNIFLTIQKDSPRNIFSNSVLSVLAGIRAELIDGKKFEKRINSSKEKTVKAVKDSYNTVLEKIIP